MMIRKMNIGLSISPKRKNPLTVGVQLSSYDKNFHEFEISFLEKELEESDAVDILTVFESSKRVSESNTEIRDGSAFFSFDTTLIDRDEVVTNYVYLKSGDSQAEIGAFRFDVKLSEIDKGAKVIAKAYDKNYEALIQDFEKEIRSYLPKLETMNQEESIRQEEEEVRKLAEVDRVTSEGTRESAESKRVSNEEERKLNEVERISKDSERDSKIEVVEGLQADLISGAVDSASVQQHVEERYGQLEEEYAPKLTEVASQLAQKAQQADLEIERTRIDSLTKLGEGSTTGDAELIDARVGADGVTYANAGGAIRGQFDKINNDLVAHREEYIQQRQLPHFNHAMQEYVNLDKFWDALRDGKIYTTEFNQFSVSPSPNGTKLDDNADLTMEPSTNTVAGRDDYSKIGLFKPIEVNAYVDENDDYHVVAIQGDGRFKRDGSMGDVYIMNMVGYTKYVSDDLKWSISYSDSMHAGFEVIQEAVKPDGTIRPYLLHAKYIAGRNPLDGKLASISGVYAEYSAMSHNHQITKFKEKGIQYSGKTSHDDFWVQLMMWLKYANMSSDNVMKGCQNYYLRYDNLVAETNVKRVVVTNAQGNALLVGSTVDITGCCIRANITDIEDLGNGNSAVYVDAGAPFNTTLSTKIETYPWNSGSCDSVLGVDGSPTSFTSGKEPFIINGIEMAVGGYEVLQNLIILNNSVDNRTDVYINYDCLTYSTSITSDYDLAGQISTTNGAWGYGSKVEISDNHLSLILVTETGGSSTTGTGDGIYTDPPSTGGLREWVSLGALSRGTHCGLRSLYASYSLAGSSWTILGRLSATGRSRRHAGVN